MKRHLPWVLLSGLVLGACEDLPPTHPEEVPPNAVLVPSVPFGEAIGQFRYSSGLEKREHLVIRDQGQWSTLWKRITARSHPSPALPRVDFSEQMIVLAAMGTVPSGGYAVRLEGVYRAGDGLYAAVKEISPGAGCFVTGALTQPLDAVLVPASEEPVRFVRDPVVHDCD